MRVSLFDLQRSLREQGILISFSGRFSQEIIEELGEAVKKYLEAETTSQSLSFNVFSVFIEQTQNIKNYSSTRDGIPFGDEIAASGIVTIGKAETGYYICSGNLIHNQDVAYLDSRLTLLRSLDKTELKKLYKEQMKKEIQPGSSGAGLGLIDMAKRASLPLEYSIVKQSDGVSFFTLCVYL